MLRDNTGMFICGYGAMMKGCSVLKAELWGMRVSTMLLRDNKCIYNLYFIFDEKHFKISLNMFLYINFNFII